MFFFVPFFLCCFHIWLLPQLERKCAYFDTDQKAGRVSGTRSVQVQVESVHIQNTKCTLLFDL